MTPERGTACREAARAIVSRGNCVALTRALSTIHLREGAGEVLSEILSEMEGSREREPDPGR